MGAVHTILKPAPGAERSPGPWVAQDDGVIVAADGKVVCVLGCPDDGLAEQDITNGAAVLAVPELVEALRAAETFMAGFEGDELQDGIDQRLATIRAALAKTEGRADG